MKHLLVFITILLVSCTTIKKNEVDKIDRDTVYIEVQDVDRVRELEADVRYWRDSVYHLNSTIPLDVYFNARKIEKIKYYISITENRPANKKFFYGWIKRTMSE